MIFKFLRRSNSPKRITIERFKRDKLDPEIGNYVKLWLKPNTNVVFFYEGGSAGGQGLLGIKDNRTIANHLKNNTVVSATLISKSKDYYTIEYTLNQ